MEEKIVQRLLAETEAFHKVDDERLEALIALRAAQKEFDRLDTERNLKIQAITTLISFAKPKD